MDPVTVLDALPLPASIEAFAAEVRSRGGSAYLVGGWVRDYLRGETNDDYDIEVYGLDQATLLSVIGNFGQADLVGRSFGIIKARFGSVRCDIGFPRTESKTGKGHRGFLVTPDPSLSFAVASARRDFTINSMGIRLPERSLEDPHGGREDLRLGLLRHVSNAFGEDPLRVLRGIQFAARFSLTMAPETKALCRTLPLEELSRERIHGEWNKLLHLADRPSIGLALMEDLDVLRYFPELAALRGTPQDPERHPEGDVWTHTLLVVDEAARLKNQLTESLDREVFMLAALSHDFGKPETTVFKDGRWKSPGHAAIGADRAREFVSRFLASSDRMEAIVVLVREHMIPKQFYSARTTVSDAAIRRLAQRVNIRHLELLGRADHLGRTTAEARAGFYPAGDWLLERAHFLGVLEGPEAPILLGRHLLALGMKPGPRFGFLLDEAYHRQTEGSLRSLDEALNWAKQILSHREK